MRVLTSFLKGILKICLTPLLCLIFYLVFLVSTILLMGGYENDYPTNFIEWFSEF